MSEFRSFFSNLTSKPVKIHFSSLLLLIPLSKATIIAHLDYSNNFQTVLASTFLSAVYCHRIAKMITQLSVQHPPMASCQSALQAKFHSTSARSDMNWLIHYLLDLTSYDFPCPLSFSHSVLFAVPHIWQILCKLRVFTGFSVCDVPLQHPPGLLPRCCRQVFTQMSVSQWQSFLTVWFKNTISRVLPQHFISHSCFIPFWCTYLT